MSNSPNPPPPPVNQSGGPTTTTTSIGTNTGNTSSSATAAYAPYTPPSSLQAITKLSETGSNYHSWANSVKHYLKAQGLWSFVDGTIPMPPASDPNFGPWHMRNEGAIFTIMATLDEALQAHLDNVTSAFGLWVTLKTKFVATNSAAAFQKFKAYFTHKLTEGTSLATQLNEHGHRWKELLDTKILEDPDMLRIFNLLNSLPESYANLVEPILHTTDPSTLKYDEIYARILAEEARRASPTTSAAVRTGKSRQSGSRAEDKCNYCHKKGHWEADCRKKKKDEEKKRGGGGGGGNASTSTSTTPAAVHVITAEASSSQSANIAASFYGSGDTLWMLDSGCTQHMTPYITDFIEYSQFDTPSHATLADNSSSMATLGSGRVTGITFVNNKPITIALDNVLLCPQLAYRTIAIRCLDNKGFTVTHGNSQARIERHGTTFGIGSLRNGQYWLSLQPSPAVHSVSHAALSVPITIAHQRFGHLNWEALHTLRGEDPKVLGLTLDKTPKPESPCEGCMLGKQHRRSFKISQTPPASEPFALVHSDLDGPMRTPSITGSSYFCTFLDDHSGVVWVYYLKSKDEAITAFRKFKAMVETQYSRKIKVFRSDRGGEYMSREFQTLLETEGIIHNRTTPSTPEQNGKAERINRTLVEAAKSMLHAAGLSDGFWEEAVKTAVHVRNRAPHRGLGWRTPVEVLTGKKPDVSYFRVFGCLVYRLVLRDNRTKLEPNSEPMVFVGYEYGTKGYRLWDKRSRRIVISTDAVFDEQVFPNRPTPPIPPKPPLIVRPSSVEPLTPPSQTNLSHDHGEHEEEPPLEQVGAPPDNAQPDPDPEAAPDEPAQPGTPPLPPRIIQPPVTPPPAPPRSPPSVHDQRRAARREHFERQELRHSSRERKVARAWREALAATEEELDEATAAAVTFPEEPLTFKQAMRSDARTHWEQAMQEEINSLKRHGTWELVDLPSDRKAVKCKWVYKVKFRPDGEIERYKARLVAKGFTQVKGIDFDETFAPVARLDSLRYLLALAALEDWEIHQVDVKSAYLNGELDEEIYMEQPEGFVAAGEERKVCRLLKALYGLKQAGRQWHLRLRSVLEKLGFVAFDSGDVSIFVLRRQVGDIIILIVYVDDITLMGNSLKLIIWTKEQLGTHFDISDLGEISHYLGIGIVRDRKNRHIYLNQERYAISILQRLGMADCKPVRTPLAPGTHLVRNTAPREDADPEFISRYRSIVGSLMYAMLGTRPDLAYTVSRLAQFQENPAQEHLAAAIHVLRYLQGTKDYRLILGRGETEKYTLTGYSDSDWAADLDDSRSQSGWVFKLGIGAVCWTSSKQPTVSRSSTAAEYRAASDTAAHLIWLQGFANQIGFPLELPIEVLVDNKGAIDLSERPVFNKRSKHLRIHAHYVHETHDNGLLRLVKVHTDDNTADVLTKPLTWERHQRHVKGLGLRPHAAASGGVGS